MSQELDPRLRVMECLAAAGAMAEKVAATERDRQTKQARVKDAVKSAADAIIGAGLVYPQERGELERTLSEPDAALSLFAKFARSLTDSDADAPPPLGRPVAAKQAAANGRRASRAALAESDRLLYERLGCLSD